MKKVNSNERYANRMSCFKTSKINGQFFIPSGPLVHILLYRVANNSYCESMRAGLMCVNIREEITFQ